MTHTDFHRLLAQQLAFLGIPQHPAGLADWIAACWPLIAEDPDPVRWAREYGEVHARV